MVILKYSLLPFLASLIIGYVTGASDEFRDERQARTNALIEWLKSDCDGFVHENTEIRKGEEGHYGLFTKGEIEDGEVILEIPRQCLFPVGSPKVGDYVIARKDSGEEWFSGIALDVRKDEDDTTYYRVKFQDGDVEDAVREDDIYIETHGEEMLCSTVDDLVREMKLGEKSKYAPYVLDLLAQPTGQLPGAWTPAGRYLLSSILMPDAQQGSEPVIPPYDVGEAPTCRRPDEPKDDLEEFAAQLLVQRGWDAVLIPVYDMFSHRNGRYLNTDSTTAHGKEEVKVMATRDIKSGEQLYTSYNLCSDCSNRKFGYGTPEILRDYGFVEQFPQRWFVHQYNIAFELDMDANSGNTILTWLYPEGLLEERVEPGISAQWFLEEELERLNILKEISFSSPDPNVRKSEWDTSKQYLDAVLYAFEEALAYLRANSYDELDRLPLPHNLYYSRHTCVVSEKWDFTAYNRTYEKFKSPYQNQWYYHDPLSTDTCFNLDDTLQMCDSYRPHYHEMATHYPARFLNEVQRVLFVGGGDSMLLHDILKYDTLELVVGLELDQTVTRLSFKYFGTQPHWDNDKVQWWYGDAAKSMLMLPKEYYGTFDLVLVDLSETVVASTVSEGLDIMGALGLLLKPDGIIVKNEFYFESFSSIYQYALQIHYYDVPMLCSQSLVLGSNKIDFLNTPQNDHGVDVLFKEHFTDKKEFDHDIWHDYQHNKMHTKMCKGEDDIFAKVPEEQKQSPGILMILEVEDAKAALDSSKRVENILDKVIKKEKLNLDSYVVSENEGGVEVIAVTKEGYIVARTLPNKQYCAFDIHLWSSFEKMESVKKTLILAVKGGSNTKSTSSYRIVAGGMFGVKTWKEDYSKRGPLYTLPCNDSEEKASSDTAADESAINQVLEQSLGLIGTDNDLVVAVVCGPNEDSYSCQSLQAFENSVKVATVIPLYSCPSLLEGDGKNFLLDCQNTLLENIEAKLSNSKRINAVVIDPESPYVMGNIIYNMFKKPRNKAMLAENVKVLVPLSDPPEEWRRNLLDRFHRDIYRRETTAYATKMFLNGTDDSSIELGIMSLGDEKFTTHLKQALSSIEDRTGLVVDVIDIHGGMLKYQHDFGPTNFLSDDYNQTEPLGQWKSQEPLGSQSIYQMESQELFAAGDYVQADYRGAGKFFPGTIGVAHPDLTYDIMYDDGGFEYHIPRAMIVSTKPTSTPPELLSENVRSAFARALLEAKLDESMASAETKDFVSDIGDGTVHVALWSGGSIVVLWDGRFHVDINIFTYKESDELHEEFNDNFLAELPQLVVMLNDKQPRGVGRVVNFLRDVGTKDTREDPHWLVKESKQCLSDENGGADCND